MSYNVDIWGNCIKCGKKVESTGGYCPCSYWIVTILPSEEVTIKEKE